MRTDLQDPVFRVRKATALNLDKVIKVVGEVGIKRLLPAYVRLTKDDVYRVSDATAAAKQTQVRQGGGRFAKKEDLSGDRMALNHSYLLTLTCFCRPGTQLVFCL